MRHVHLPAQHTDADLALAGAVASLLQSSDLYVAWSMRAGRAQPVVPAALGEPAPQAPPRPRALRRLIAGLRRGAHRAPRQRLSDT